MGFVVFLLLGRWSLFCGLLLSIEQGKGGVVVREIDWMYIKQFDFILKIVLFGKNGRDRILYMYMYIIYIY